MICSFHVEIAYVMVNLKLRLVNLFGNIKIIISIVKVLPVYYIDFCSKIAGHKKGFGQSQ